MKLTKKIIALPAISLALLLSDAHAAVKPLVDAAARGETELVQQLLRDGADVNEAQGDGMTALHWAAETGNLELADMLIYAGSNLDAGTRIGQYTPLHVASRQGHADIVQSLIAAGANVEATTTNSGARPIHLAAASGNANAVAALLEAGAALEAREGRWGQTPLIFAAAANRIDTLKVLLDAGADHSVTSSFRDVSQMEQADRAAERRVSEFLAEFKEKEGGGPNWQPQPSQVQAAIEASREIQRKWPNVPDPSCDDYVAEDGGEDKNKCANAVTYDADGNPVYDYKDEGDPDNPQPPSYGQRVDKWGGLTPLLHAARQGHREATLLLLDHGADINQASAGDQTSPLLMATINGQFDLALDLVRLGADPNLASSHGTTPLFAAIERRWGSKSSYSHPTEHQQQQATHLDVMQALLDAGAEPNARLSTHLWYSEYTFSVIGNQSAGLHYMGATPFWRAAHALDVDAMRMLKEHGADPHIPTTKMPERRRRRPAPMPAAEIKEGDAQKTVTSGLAAPAATNPEPAKEKDPSGIPEVPVGGPFVAPIHVVAGAGYGQSWAANAHIHAPGAWMAALRFMVEECGADVNLRDANAYTPLHHAASRGDTEAVQYLIDKGADVMVVSRKGETTVDMANSPYQRIPPYPETIALLESYGAINNHNCVSC